MKKSNIWVERLLRNWYFHGSVILPSMLNYRELKLARPEGVIGKNTVSAMQAGIVYGYVGQVEGIVKRMKAQSKTRSNGHCNRRIG